ncbi:MAG: UTP--glucose-1-phosphate uridylyltransferase [Gammaproteobacteria bacterium]|nr:UTP--glucose-1-phosphate uridylyltransferase [Gammaproteobacteria bacterium]
MRVRKAVITAAAQSQRTLPMQTLFDQQGVERSVLSLIVREAVRAGISEICIVVWPGDEEPYAKLVADDGVRLTFVQQTEARGYAHAVWSAREFVKGDPFLHLVGDHIYVSRENAGCAQRLVEAAEAEGSAVSGVQVTRENLLPLYGTVGGQPVSGKPGLYRVEAVVEKPTPTEAEQRLVVPGLRSGQYLCFFGMHVLTPSIFEILGGMLENGGNPRVSLSSALSALAARQQYLAIVQNGRRYDVGVKYGLFTAQLALALNGQDREHVLAEMVNVLAAREMFAPKGAHS